MLVLLLAVVATLVIARIAAASKVAEASTTQEPAALETAVFEQEPVYIVEVLPTLEPVSKVVARYENVTMTEEERQEMGRDHLPGGPARSRPRGSRQWPRSS